MKISVLSDTRGKFPWPENPSETQKQAVEEAALPVKMLIQFDIKLDICIIQ